MNTENAGSEKKQGKAPASGTPIGRLTISEVDAALVDCDKTVKTHSETVKAKLAANAAIAPVVLRELSRANVQRSRLVLRRISLLIEAGDSTTTELVEKLLRVKPAKTS